MRTKKRPDWGIQAFKFYVEPTCEIPQEVWDISHLQQETWNKLCELREEYRTKYLALGTEGKSIRETMNSEQKKAFWDEFTNGARAIVDTSGLGWEDTGDLLERFMIAHRRGFKQDAGAPKMKHGGLKKVRLVHRFSGGGWDISKITSTRAERFAFQRIPHARHYEYNVRTARRSRIANLRFGIGKISIPLRINLHRQLPTDGFIKTVVLCGEFVPLPKREWRWYVVITVETEPKDVLPRSPHHAGLDLGWRKCKEPDTDSEYIRVGYIIDDNENEIELRLPLDFSTAQAKHQGYPCTYKELRELESSIALHLEAAKAQLRELNIIPVSLTQMRQGGLSKFRRELESRESELLANEFRALEMLREWQHTNDRLQTRHNKSAERFVGRRQWLYRNLAAWLTKTYGVISWEDDLDVKEMAESETDEPALKASMSYRQIAAIGEFRQMLKHAAQKNAITLFGGKTAFSTVDCAICGERAEASSSLYLVCPNGHRFDQDKNAAHNLFSQIPPNIDTDIDLRNNGAERAVIPQELRRVAVYVHS